MAFLERIRRSAPRSSTRKTHDSHAHDARLWRWAGPHTQTRRRHAFHIVTRVIEPCARAACLSIRSQGGALPLPRIGIMSTALGPCPRQSGAMNTRQGGARHLAPRPLTIVVRLSGRRPPPSRQARVPGRCRTPAAPPTSRPTPSGTCSSPSPSAWRTVARPRCGRTCTGATSCSTCIRDAVTIGRVNHRQLRERISRQMIARLASRPTGGVASSAHVAGLGLVGGGEALRGGRGGQHELVSHLDALG